MKTIHEKTLLGRLADDPRAILAELGDRLPEDLEIKVVQDDEEVVYLHIPAAPPEGELQDADLLAVEGGTFGIVASTAACMVFASRLVQITPNHP